jgi:hypothetical protein
LPVTSESSGAATVVYHVNVSAASPQNVSIAIMARAPGTCDPAKQQQLKAAVLQELTARTSQDNSSAIRVGDAVCSTLDDRRREARSRALVSTYQVLASATVVLDRLSGLQTSLQQKLGALFTLGE